MAKKTTKKKAKKKTSKKKTSKKKVINSEDDLLKELAKDFELDLSADDVKDECPYYIPFKNKALQMITGGVPGGCMTEVHGKSLAGKSFILYELGLQTIKMNGWFLLFDVERAYNKRYGKRVGLFGNSRFVRSKKRILEQMFSEAKKFITKVRMLDKDCPILIGWDSYPPIQIKLGADELAKNDGKELKGYIAAKKNSIFSQMIGDFNDFIHEHKATFVLLNQTRNKMNVLFGDTTTTNADEIIQFYSTLRLRGRLGAKEKDADTKNRKLGMETIWETVKNRNLDPFIKVTVMVNYRKGVSEYSGLLELLSDLKVLKKVKIGNSNGYQYKKTKIKKNQAKALVKKYPEVLEMPE